MFAPHVVEVVRALEPTGIDTFRPVEHLPKDKDLLLVMPGHEGDIKSDPNKRLL